MRNQPAQRGPQVDLCHIWARSKQLSAACSCLWTLTVEQQEQDYVEIAPVFYSTWHQDHVAGWTMQLYYSGSIDSTVKQTLYSLRVYH